MPLLPDVTVKFQDGQLGVSGPDTDNIHVKVGVATAGTLNQLLSFTDKQQVKDTLGGGPLAEAVAVALTKVKPVYAMRCAASTAGSVSAVTATPVDSGTGTVTVDGDPLDRYDAQVKITRTGDLGTAAFQYSVDGGDTFSPEIAVPSGGGTYAIAGTGLTLTFVAGGGPVKFEAGDVHTFTATAPAATLTDLNDAFDALLADPTEWFSVHVVGEATPAIAAGLATRMDEAETGYRFAGLVLEARDVDATTDSGSEDTWITNLKTEYANFSHTRVDVVAGHCEVASQLTGRSDRRSAAWAYTARLASIAPQTHPGEVDLGPLAGVTKLYHDEQKKPGLDAAGFTTLRTIIGRKGFYVTRGRIMCPPGSDYHSEMIRRVVDKAAKIARNAALDKMNKDVVVDATTGFIAETDARAVESYVNGQLFTNVVSTGNASAASVTLKRDSNILSTSATSMKVQVIPKGYLEVIEVDIGLGNPALASA